MSETTKQTLVFARRTGARTRIGTLLPNARISPHPTSAENGEPEQDRSAGVAQLHDLGPAAEVAPGGQMRRGTAAALAEAPQVVRAGACLRPTLAPASATVRPARARPATRPGR